MSVIAINNAASVAKEVSAAAWFGSIAATVGVDNATFIPNDEVTIDDAPATAKDTMTTANDSNMASDANAKGASAVSNNDVAIADVAIKATAIDAAVDIAATINADIWTNENVNAVGAAVANHVKSFVTIDFGFAEM